MNAQLTLIALMALGVASDARTVLKQGNITLEEVVGVMKDFQVAMSQIFTNDFSKSLLENIRKDRPDKKIEFGEQDSVDLKSDRSHMTFLDLHTRKDQKSMYLTDFRVLKETHKQSSATGSSGDPAPQRRVNKRSATKCPVGKYSSIGGSQCTDCPPGTFSNTAGSSKCQQCDLNFAKSDQAGMDRCDWCPNNGVTRNKSACFTKVDPKCAVTPKGDNFSNAPNVMCQKTIDNNVESEGVSGDLTFLNSMKLPELPQFFSYLFSPPIRLRRTVLWHKPGCCKDDLNHLKLLVNNAVACLIDGRERAASTESYSFVNYCEVDNVENVTVIGQEGKIFKMSEIGFYAE